MYHSNLCLFFSLQSGASVFAYLFANKKAGCVLVYKSVIGVLLIFRASRELDRHTGDSPGGYGVPAEVSRGHDGGAAQRRGAIRGRCQENSGHGERQSYNSVKQMWICKNTVLSPSFINVKY